MMSQWQGIVTHLIKCILIIDLTLFTDKHSHYFIFSLEASLAERRKWKFLWPGNLPGPKLLDDLTGLLLGYSPELFLVLWEETEMKEDDRPAGCWMQTQF